MSETKNVRCLVCDSVDQWENVDQYTTAKKNLCICKNCGFVTYPDKIANKDDLLKFYKDDYRKAPTIQNLHTGQTKLNYHSIFLADTINKWRKEGKEEIDFFDVGCAYGLTLKWIKTLFPKANVDGAELTKTFKRVAFYEFGFRLKDEFDDSKKYDMVMSYKVAEHIIDVDNEIKKYLDSLKEGGYLYISVPTWFHELKNFGMGGFDLNNYYHPNHINVWTREMFEHVIAKCGGKIVNFDNVLYGETYLVQKDSSIKAKKFESQYDFVIKALEDIKKAYSLFEKGETKQALDVYPNYPTAFLNHIHTNMRHFKNNFEGLKELLENAIKCCPTSNELMNLAIDKALGFEQFEYALNKIEENLKLRPNDPNTLTMLMHCYKEMAIRNKNTNQAIEQFAEALRVARQIKSSSMRHNNEATNWIYAMEAELPIPELLEENK